MIVPSIALLATISAAPAQEQEHNLTYRLLRPNLTLVNPAQARQFQTVNRYGLNHTISKQPWIPNRWIAKTVAGQNSYRTSQFATFHFQAAGKTANTFLQSNTIKNGNMGTPLARDATHVARENSRYMPVTSFSTDRPLGLSRRTPQDLVGHEKPLTIEQVRELLNKSK